MFAAVAVILAVIAAKLAGMDGNRTHPGRLSSAPQTILKTAGLASIKVHWRPYQFSYQRLQSIIVFARPHPSAGLAVFLAVTEAITAVQHDCRRPVHESGVQRVSAQKGPRPARCERAAGHRARVARRESLRRGPLSMGSGLCSGVADR